MNHGLTKRDIILLNNAFTQFSEIERVILFGSRAQGTFKLGSDVDLAIVGTAVTHTTTIQLAGILNEELPLPYFFDVLNYQSISNSELRTHIDQFGVIVYNKIG